MIFMLIGGVLLAVFSGAILLHAIPTASHHYVLPRPPGTDHPKILGTHIVVGGAWSIVGLIIGLCLIAAYFMF